MTIQNKIKAKTFKRYASELMLYFDARLKNNTIQDVLELCAKNETAYSLKLLLIYRKYLSLCQMLFYKGLIMYRVSCFRCISITVNLCCFYTFFFRLFAIFYNSWVYFPSIFLLLTRPFEYFQLFSSEFFYFNFLISLIFVGSVAT